MEIRLKEVEWVSRVMRIATPGAMAYAAVFPLVQVGLIAESTALWRGGGYADGAWALVATACYLPLHLRHVRYATRGSRAPGGAWTLAVMTVVVVAALPLGDLWLPTFHVVAVSALLVLRPRWSLVLVAAVVTVQVPLSLVLDSEVQAAPSYYAVTVLWRSAAVFAPIWLVGAVRRLEEARRVLADEAVVRERLRIDGELRETLGAALRSIAARGQGATVLVGGAREPLEQELDALVGGARHTLAQARRMVSGYQRASLSAELDTAATLLTAAGIETQVLLPSEGVPDTADAALRSALRADIARLLRDDATGRCVITVTHQAGRVQVDVRSSSPPSGLVPVGAS
jgi:two-component system sensor histidine kinase DesK